MAFLLGAILGVAMLSMIWEWALFMRVMNDPVHGKLASVTAAWLTASTLYTLSGSGLAVSPFFLYGVAAVVVGTIAYFRGVKLRRES